MIFTVVTIIFLPLSFMSSVFGMNASELSGSDGGIMSLRHQFSFMCTELSNVPFPQAPQVPDRTTSLTRLTPRSPYIYSNHHTNTLFCLLRPGCSAQSSLQVTGRENLMSFIQITLFAVFFEYSGLYYLWRFHISNYPIAKWAQKAWKTSIDRWNANGLAKRREDRSKQVEKRRALQEKTLNGQT